MRFQHIPGLVRLGGYVTARHNRGMSDSATTPPRKPDEPQVTSATPEDGAPLPQITTKQAAKINAPIRGMIISMAVLLMLILPFLWLAPKPDAQPYRADVNVSEEAGFVAEQADFTPAAPELGEDWTANYARWQANSQEGVPLWSVGYLSPNYRLVEMVQTAESNPTWLAQRTELIPATGQKNVGGISWDIHHRDPSGKQEEFTAWVGELNDSTVILTGKATEGEFEHVAKALAEGR